MKRLAPLALLATAAAASAGVPGDPVVVTADGSLRGERMADGRALFRGIPFAAPPVGARRWRPPALPARWRGVRDARVSAPSCAQNDDGWNAASAARSDEDCLYLEVGTPTLTPKHPLPVMVWIHGGSNKAGGAPGTVASSLVARGVVLVAIQYRLGPLGFMAHPALTAESPVRASGNYGLMDQQAALRWVRRNIARFGGDARNVTIFGGSAGAEDVGLQQLSPLAAGLFDKAIAQSGTASFGWAPRTLAESEAIGARIAALAGAPDATAAQLRAIPATRLLAAARDMPAPPGLPDAGTAWLQATIDGHVLREAPALTLARGGGQRVPLLIGANAREIGFYADAAQARAAMTAAYGARAPYAAYGLDGGASASAETLMRVATDIVFTCPAMLVADARARAGVPVWRYHFAYAPPAGPAVTHGSELRLVLGGSSGGAPPLQDYWVNFARTGDPNGAGLPHWPAFGARRAYLRFGDTATPATALAAAECAAARYP